MEYSLGKAGSLSTPLSFTSTQRTRMIEGARDEDIPVDRTLNHGYNPLLCLLTPNPPAWLDVPVRGTPARDEALTRWNSMVTQFVNGQFDGGDDVGAWHFLGRVSHLLQDMSSPLHAVAQPHNPCMFEDFWKHADSILRSDLSSIGGPLLSSSSLPSEGLAMLDSFSQQRLQYRYNNSSPYKYSDDVRGWIDVLAWITYFRSTFWGEIFFGESGSSGRATFSQTTSTSFSDESVTSKPNTLNIMFNNNVWWIAGWDDNYYSIADRLGYIFIFMSWTDIDDWSSCGRNWMNGQQDSSIRIPTSWSRNDEDRRGVRITGRFWFDTREIGKSTSGNYNRRCYPHKYPNGDSMSDERYCQELCMKNL